MPLGEHFTNSNGTKKRLHWKAGLCNSILMQEEGRDESLSFDASTALKSYEFSTIETGLGTFKLSVVYMVWDEAHKKEAKTMIDLKKKKKLIPTLRSEWFGRSSSPISRSTTQKITKLILQQPFKKEESRHRLSIETDLTNHDADEIQKEITMLENSHQKSNGLNIQWHADSEYQDVWSNSTSRKYYQWSFTKEEKRRKSFCNDLFGSFVGTYEESILNGRVSTLPSKPIEFVSEIGVFGRGACKAALRCPPHAIIPFAAYFYQIEDTESPSPYVGDIDLHKNLMNQKYPGMYRVPPKGQLQILIKNINKMVVKIFLVAYDVSDMPIESKIFLRQVSHRTVSPMGLCYAIQINMMCDQNGRIFLHKNIRVVFSNCLLDEIEKLDVVTSYSQVSSPVSQHQSVSLPSQHVSRLSEAFASQISLNESSPYEEREQKQDSHTDKTVSSQKVGSIIDYKEPFSSDYGTLLSVQHDP
jgi:hypothetical protein